MIRNTYIGLLLIPLAIVLPGCSRHVIKRENIMAKRYIIDQTDKDRSDMVLKGSFTDGDKKFKGDVKVVTKGKNGKMVSSTKKYSYLNEWTIDFVYDELWDQLTFDMGVMGQCAISKNEIQYKAKLKFDLSTINDKGEFTVKVINPYSKVGTLYMVCVNKFGTQTIPINKFSKTDGVVFTKGKIINMTENGAIITFPNSYIYDSKYYKTLTKPFILKIKKK